MKISLIPIVASVLLGPLAVWPVAAQVQVDPRALDALAPPPGGTPPPATTAAPADQPLPSAASKSGAKAGTTVQGQTPKGAAAPARSSGANSTAGKAPPPRTPAPAPPAPPGKPVPPTIPIAPPPAAVIPPPIIVPIRPPPPPQPATITPDAPGEAAAIPGGARITFGAGRADLNAATDSAIRALARDPAAGSGAGATFTILASAAGTPEDPSTARRLSLDRALAVRSVLMAEGIASVRIYVRALGATDPTGSQSAPGGAAGSPPADRVDILRAVPPGEVPTAGTK